MAGTTKSRKKTPPKPKKKKLRKVYPLRGEEWKLVEGTEDYYISSYGRFMKVNHLGENLRSISVDPEGYCRVNIGKKKCRLHRLVAEAFVPNPNNLPVVDHLDTNKKNCRADNLEWVTQRTNVQRASDVGLNTGGISTLALAIDPDGKGYLFKNLADCSKGLDLPERATYKVAAGKQVTTRGYKVIKLTNFEDRRKY